MVPRHVVMTNQRNIDVNLLQTCQATIIVTNHVDVWPTTLSKIDFARKNYHFFVELFENHNFTKYCNSNFEKLFSNLSFGSFDYNGRSLVKCNLHLELQKWETKCSTVSKQ